MKIDCIIKSGGIAPTDFSGMFARIGAIIDVMSMAEPLLARPNWRMKGYTLEEAQARAVYALDSGVNRTRLAELEDEYRGKDVSSIGIWLDGRREGLGASIEIMACGGTFPDTVSVDAGAHFSIEKTSSRASWLGARRSLHRWRLLRRPTTTKHNRHSTIAPAWAGCYTSLSS
ncbi:hypothetical protein QZM68_31555 [Burkholderia gladioli]|uniref:hypothetical protein n=1 Tax=Burkholderia gladioli TaxID=28095 RepID=UPI00264D6332|nr:hypothetical protein [Burkholderia gladioli]MDN7604308.1 hypothetical protein [Burkholderia gladioli]